ncbi:hypothetical protein V6251_15030 [Olleya sp. Ti.3.14]|uniref:hypothetical protein n=1 Tax=Olleya sp. Ti.3.14 TaxID=3121297 RepID=UPI00311D6C77
MNYKFREYNWILKDMLTEEDTIDNVLTRYLDSKPSREQKKILKNPEEWAKYAFENESQYYVTFYNEENKPFVCVNFKKISINLTFLEHNKNNELVEHLRMVYDRYDIMHWLDKDEYKPHLKNKLFLKQIEVFHENEKEKNTYKALFIQKNKIMRVSTTKMNKDTKTYSNEKKETKVNLSHNFIEPPKHYLDYEHLFDYNEILKPEYLDIPLNKKDFIFKNGTRYYKDEQGNLIEDN